MDLIPARSGNFLHVDGFLYYFQPKSKGRTYWSSVRKLKKSVAPKHKRSAERMFNLVSKYNTFVLLAIISHFETSYFHKIYFRQGFVLENENLQNEILKIRKFKKVFFEKIKL